MLIVKEEWKRNIVRTDLQKERNTLLCRYEISRPAIAPVEPFQALISVSKDSSWATMPWSVHRHFDPHSSGKRRLRRRRNPSRESGRHWALPFCFLISDVVRRSFPLGKRWADLFRRTDIILSLSSESHFTAIDHLYLEAIWLAGWCRF